MSDAAWKRRERQACKPFGTTRKAGSGSQNQVGQTCSDSNHPSLYIETKYRKNHACLSLYDDVAEAAAKEAKVPVVALAERAKAGVYYLIHESHLAFVLGCLTEDQVAKVTPIKYMPTNMKKRPKWKPSVPSTT